MSFKCRVLIVFFFPQLLVAPSSKSQLRGDVRFVISFKFFCRLLANHINNSIPLIAGERMRVGRSGVFYSLYFWECGQSHLYDRRFVSFSVFFVYLAIWFGMGFTFSLIPFAKKCMIISFPFLFFFISVYSIFGFLLLLNLNFTILS